MLKIAETVMQEITQACEAGYPLEVCGLMLGTDADGARQVQRIVPAKNLNTTRAQDRYELDPAAFLQADQLARAEGLEVVGIYHSHPDHPAQASATDTDRAWASYSYLIVAVFAGRLDSFRAWCLDGAIMQEEPVEVIHG